MAAFFTSSSNNYSDRRRGIREAEQLCNNFYYKWEGAYTRRGAYSRDSTVYIILSHLLEKSAHWINNIVLFRSTLHPLLHANLFNVKFYTVKDRPCCGARCTASIYICACAAQCTSWLIMWLCQSASQRNSLVVLQLRSQWLPREDT